MLLTIYAKKLAFICAGFFIFIPGGIVMVSLSILKFNDAIIIFVSQGVIIITTVTISSVAKVEHVRENGVHSKSIDCQQSTNHRTPVGF